MKLHLTDMAVQNLKSERQADFWDTTLSGFGVRVGPRAKTFFLKTGNKRLSLGRYPHTSLKDARKEAHKRLAAPHLPHTSRTFEATKEEFMREYEIKNKPVTVEGTRRLLTYFDATTYIHTFTRKSIMDDIGDLKPSEANHAFTAIRTFLNWTVANQYLTHTPLNRVKLLHKTRSRERVLSDEEVRQLWCLGLTRGYPFGHILCLLVTTGQRIGEISKLTRGDIDAADQTITFPDTKNNQPHKFPYGQFASLILAEVLRHHNHDRLFPTYGKSYEMKSVRNALDIPHWTPHDLRRTYSTTHARLETPIDIIEALLNHKTGSRSGVQRIYNRYNRMEPMRAAVERHDAFLRDLLPPFPQPAT